MAGGNREPMRSSEAAWMEGVEATTSGTRYPRKIQFLLLSRCPSYCKMDNFMEQDKENLNVNVPAFNLGRPDQGRPNENPSAPPLRGILKGKRETKAEETPKTYKPIRF